MESNDPSDATPTDRGDGDETGADGDGDGADRPATGGDESLESTDGGDEAGESIPDDAPGRPAGTPDDASASGAGAAEADGIEGGASTAATAGGAETPADAEIGEAGAPGSASSLAPDEQYCYSCGAVIKREAVICPECGVSQDQSASSDTDPGIAALLSAVGFIVPIAAGAGQIYNGEIGKGIAFGVVQLVNVFLVFLLIGFITYPLVGIWAIYDAYQNAQ